ncbi:CpaF family protein, partial [Corallococcus exiguus]|nr:CpaF family protein [Corallococcus exiguus]
DKTPPPTRNPFAEQEDTRSTPPSEPLVQVSADLLAEAPPARNTPPPRRPPPAPVRPGTPPANTLRAGATPTRRPPGPPPPPSDEDEDDDRPKTELNTSEKTQIRPAPDRSRR